MTTVAGALALDTAQTAVTTGLGAYLQAAGAPTQVNLPSIFSDDVASDGTSGGWYDHSVGVQDIPFRGVIKFNASTAPAGTLSKVELGINVTYNFGNGSMLYNYGPYGSVGRNDPQSDSGITRWQRCDVSTNYYLSNQIHFRTVAVHLIDLGASAVQHLQSIINDRYAFFCLAMMQLDETTPQQFGVFAGYASQTSGATYPFLRLTYSSGKIAVLGLSAYLSVGGALPKSLDCGMGAYIVPVGWAPQPKEESPWTIEMPEDGTGLIIP